MYWRRSFPAVTKIEDPLSVARHKEIGSVDGGDSGRSVERAMACIKLVNPGV